MIMITVESLKDILSKGETLRVEFKGEARRQISDKEIYEEVVALANTEGGVLLLGVEDDGCVSGAKPRHGRITEPLKLQSAIFNNTIPNINTRVSVFPYESGKPIICIEVDACPETCATRSGKSLRRGIKADGKPETIPFYPREQHSRKISLGLLDYSAQKIKDAVFDDFDPIEIERLKRSVVALRGDTSLLTLGNKDMVKALRLVETVSGKLVPNIAGLLLIGKEAAIQKYIPTHAVHFQVLDQQGNVKVNDTFSCGLLRIIDEVSSRFAARNEEKEIPVGLFRLPVPDYAPEAFREAFNNAILHRDYSRMDGVYVQWQADHMLIASPGGFPSGITINNILVHEPKPKNSRLAETFKRIGVVEQTGRGVDKIFMGQLRFGRPAPDYSRSDDTGVRVVLRGGTQSLEFASFVYEQDKNNKTLTLDELLILNAVFFERVIDSERATITIQKSAVDARAVLGQLIEKGFIEAKGVSRGRTYHMSSWLYRKLGKKEAYVRAHGISAHKHEALVMEYVEAHERIERKAVMSLCGLTVIQAKRLLKRMCQNKKLVMRGSHPRGAYYEKV